MSGDPMRSHQDLLAGRPCEINGLNGAVAAEAARLKLHAPVNATVADLVRALEVKPRVAGCHQVRVFFWESSHGF